MSRILVIDDQPPQASRDGTSLRMVTIVELLVELGHAVDFGSARGWPAGLWAPRERLTRGGAGVVALDPTPEAWVGREAPAYDVVVLSRLATAARLVDRVRRAAPDARLIYDAPDVGHVLAYRRAKLAGNAALVRRSLADRRTERGILEAVDAVIASSAADAEVIRGFGPRGPVCAVTAAHMDVAADLPPRGRRAGGVFVGYLRVVENEVAVRRLVERIWPGVLLARPGESLHIVGAGPPGWLRHLGDRLPWLTVQGGRPDIDDLLRSAAVSVLPIVGGSGIKTKALQASAFGVPVVATDDGLRGIPATDGVHAIRAEGDADLVSGVTRVLGDADLWARLSAGGASLLAEHFGREAACRGLRAALGSAGGGTEL